MMANVLSHSSGDPAITGFYENYEKLDQEQVKQLRNRRKDGQYLVAICDYSAALKFEDVVLKAIFESCRHKDLDAEIDTEYDEAERRLKEWEEKPASGGFRNFYEDFAKALEMAAPGQSVEQLRGGLKSFDSTCLEQFKDTFATMMGGIEFRSNAGNLIPIVKKLVKSNVFKERFRGLAIFFNEFNYTLESARYSKDLVLFGAVFYRQQSKTYELASGMGEDPYDLIQRYLDDQKQFS